MLKKLSLLSVAIVMVGLLFVGLSTTGCKKKATEAPSMTQEQAQPAAEVPAQGAEQPAAGEQK